MSKPYNEALFNIDLICDAYNTENPSEIKKLCKDTLDYDITESQIKDYLGLKEDYEKESWCIGDLKVF